MREPIAGSAKRRAPRFLLFLVVCGIGTIVACATIAGIDDLVVGDCKGGPCILDSGEEGEVFVDTDTGALPPDDSGVPCLGKPLPTSVRVGSAGNTFCIDATEITNGHYQQFIDAKIDPTTQPAICSWNKSFAADPTEAGTTHPVVGVDWCDALAYCSWAGKYLCGKAEKGKKIGPVTPESSSDFRSHQWMLACSAEARLRYPYGALHEPGKCNTFELDAGRPLAVGTAPGCVGGYTGLYDLVGNVWEWYDGPCRSDGGLRTAVEIDAGDAGRQSDDCWLKGGSFTNNGAQFDCRYDLPGIRRDLHDRSVGFRCCSD